MNRERDRRRFLRIVLHRPVTLVAEDGRSWTGELLDISLRGALLRLEGADPPTTGVRGVVDVGLDEDPEFMIRMQVAVRHAAPPRFGLEAVRVDLDDACRLRRLVELNAGDPDLLARELSELSAD